MIFGSSSHLHGFLLHLLVFSTHARLPSPSHRRAYLVFLQIFLAAHQNHICLFINRLSIYFSFNAHKFRPFHIFCPLRLIATFQLKTGRTLLLYYVIVLPSDNSRIKLALNQSCVIRRPYSRSQALQLPTFYFRLASILHLCLTVS